MLNEPQTAPVWVDHPKQLEKMIKDLSHYPILAVDTESNSLYVYKEQVCLIQFSTGETDYLVDPFSLPDLSSLAPLFSNPQIEKIFHAAEYDVICLKRDFEFSFVNIFDTMHAGRLLGRSGVGLASIIGEEFGIELDKHYQRANWGFRPLSQPQLSYARLDTFYLIPLRNRLQTALQTTNRWELALEDFQRMCSISPSLTENGASSCWRVAGNKDITPQQAAVLNELCKYRDSQAQKADLPPFKILGNHILLDVALASPQNRDQLLSRVRLSRFQADRFASGLAQAVQRGLREQPLYRPASQRSPDEIMRRLDLLKKWRKQVANSLGVDSDVVLPRDAMEAIAAANPKSLTELEVVMGHLPWRLKQYGFSIIRVLNKE